MNRAETLDNLGRVLAEASLPDRPDLDRDRLRLIEACAAAAFREGDAERPRIALLLGPSGGGKSTLFNALTGSRRSRVSSVERPSTLGAVAACRSGVRPDAAMMPTLAHATSRDETVRGATGTVTWIDAETPGDALLIDAPDFDTRVEENLEVAERLLYWADRIVFVTSVERYADRSAIPFLKRLARMNAATTWILNKVEEDGASLAADFAGHVASAGGPDADFVLTIARTSPDDVASQSAIAEVARILEGEWPEGAATARLGELADECRTSLGAALAAWQERRGRLLDRVTGAFAVESRFDPAAALGRLQRFEEDSKFWLRYSPRGLWRGMRRVMSSPRSIFSGPRIPDEPDAAEIGVLVVDQAWTLVEMGHIAAREAAKGCAMGREVLGDGMLRTAELSRDDVAERFAGISERLVAFTREKLEAFRRELGSSRPGIVGAVRLWVVDKIVRIIALALTLAVLPPLVFELLRFLGHPNFTNEVTRFHTEAQEEFERVFLLTGEEQAVRYREHLEGYGPAPSVIADFNAMVTKLEEDPA